MKRTDADEFLVIKCARFD